jgi:hypothetical protein
LERLLAQREPGRRNPLVRSEAWSSNTAKAAGLSRCHCLAHGRRKFRELAEDFPTERAVGGAARKLVYDQADEAREPQLREQERVAYPQP